MDHLEIKFLFNYLENNGEHLNSLQNRFIVSLNERYIATGVLTKKEVESLHDIKEDIPSLILKEAVYESDPNEYHAQYSSLDCLTSFHI